MINGYTFETYRLPESGATQTAPPSRPPLGARIKRWTTVVCWSLALLGIVLWLAEAVKLI